MRTLLLLPLLALAARAQGFTDGINPFELSGGDLKAARPPAWLREGVRLSYEVLSSAVNPAGPNANQPQQISAGGGVYHMDIVAFVRGQAAIVSEQLLKDPGTGAFVWIGAGSEVVAGGYGAGVWVDPDFAGRWVTGLAKDGPVRADFSEMEVAGEKRRVIAIQVGGGKGDTTRCHLYYDAQTGVLAQFARSVLSGGAWAPATFLRLVARRERKLPWAMGRPPSWIFRVKRLSYTGQYVTEYPGAGTFAQTFRSDNEFVQAVGNIAIARCTTAIGGNRNNQVSFISGPTQFGGFWLPPLELKGLRAGQEIDRDPVSGTTLRVTGVGPASYGRNVATLVLDGSGFELWTDYQIENGVLLALTLRNKILNTTVQAYLTEKQ